MKVLFIGYVWPEHRSSAAGIRTWSLLRAFQKANCEIFFASQAKPNHFSEELIQNGIGIQTIQSNDSDFESWVEELHPDLVIFDRFVIEEQFGWKVREKLPDCIRILDTIDLHFLRRAREAGRKSWDGPDLLRELAAIYRSDHTWVVSDFEQKLLSEELGVPSNLISRLSLGYDLPVPSTPHFFDRKNFVFIGNFRHAPNWDAVQWLSKELWSRVREKIPTAELHIYGAYPSAEAMALDAPKKGLRVLGPALDQYAMFREYRVNFAPLRFGAGVKGKILDGWQQGVPCLGTPLAAEGMMDSGGQADWGGLVADSVAEWMDAAVRLYTEPAEWIRAQKAGQRVLSERFSQAEVNHRVGELVDCIQSGVFRQKSGQNRVGQILWQEQFLAKKYLSKWIEEKNKDFTLASRVKSD